MTHQWAARDAASVHFRPNITRTDILVNIVVVKALTVGKAVRVTVRHMATKTTV